MDSDFEDFLRNIENPQLREIASLKIRGYTIQEIAAARQLAVVTVERRLRQILRMWRDGNSS